MSTDALGPQFDYRGSHAPPGPGDPTLDAAHDAYPGIYENPHWYRTGDRDSDNQSVAAIMAARGRPEAPVRVYRAVPSADMAISPGDWVSTSHAYAAFHGARESRDGEDWPVVSAVVPAGELHSESNSINEWGWHPRSSARGA